MYKKKKEFKIRPRLSPSKNRGRLICLFLTLTLDKAGQVEKGMFAS